eukprot:TRINITY_DN13884_c0_g1_i8.p1 TRINITY_DN13884_c0_g1~~TRINITY_DN13884_c0_g1_i8.p1  ORF type:complete len:359 (-),score=88.28 TRINITY_DN13884_c0_g1_i8:38-1114(-)
MCIRDRLEFDYFDENGSGLGPTLEFYSLSADALKGLSFLWRPMENGTLFPAPVDPENPSPDPKVFLMFKLAGWLCARAITDKRLMDLPFDGLFWELVLGYSHTLADITRIDKKLGEFILALDQLRVAKTNILKLKELAEEKKKKQVKELAIDGIKVEEIGLSFVLPGYPSIELKKDVLVTIENIEEYIDFVADYILHSTICRQVQAFKEGFEMVLKVEALACFKVDEIENLICGGKEDKWNIPLLSKNVVASQGFGKASPQYMFLLEYLSSLTFPMQRLFLTYATGSPRLPFGGFEKLSPKLTMVKRLTPKGLSPDHFLPSVMTCQNFLKVPEYSSYAVFKEKFDYTLREGQNSFTLS